MVQVKRMVYCQKCGAENPDKAEFCSKCGSQIVLTEKGKPYRRPEEECFGIPRGSKIFAVIVGLIIILWGVSSILQEVYGVKVPWWPIVVVVVGVLIMLGAFYRGRGGHQYSSRQ